jgi:hypothetical protein
MFSFWAYILRAFHLYDELGATTKTSQMLEKYPFLAESEHLSHLKTSD